MDQVEVRAAPAYPPSLKTAYLGSMIRMNGTYLVGQGPFPFWRPCPIGLEYSSGSRPFSDDFWSDSGPLDVDERNLACALQSVYSVPYWVGNEMWLAHLYYYWAREPSPLIHL